MKRLYQSCRKAATTVLATLFVLSGIQAWASSRIADVKIDNAAGFQTIDSVKATGNIPLEIMSASSLNPSSLGEEAAAIQQQGGAMQSAGVPVQQQGDAMRNANPPATVIRDRIQMDGLQTGQLQGPCEQIAGLFQPGQLTSCQPLGSGFSYDVKVTTPRSDATLTVDRTNNMILTSHTINQQSAGTSVDKAVQYDVTGGAGRVQETTSIGSMRATKLTFIDMAANGPIATSSYILDKESGNLYGGTETKAFTSTDPVIITSINHNLQVKTLATQAQTEIAKMDAADAAGYDEHLTQISESLPKLLAVAGNPMTGKNTLEYIAQQLNAGKSENWDLYHDYFTTNDFSGKVADIYSALVNNPQSDTATLKVIAENLTSEKLAQVVMDIFNDPRADHETRCVIAENLMSADNTLAILANPLSDGEVLDRLATKWISYVGVAQGTGSWGPAYNLYGEQITVLLNNNQQTKPETLAKVGDMLISQYSVYRETECAGKSYLARYSVLDNLLTAVKDNPKTPAETRIKIDAFYSDNIDRIKWESEIYNNPNIPNY